MDLVHSTLLIHTLYHYTILRIRDPGAIAYTVFSFNICIFLALVQSYMVQVTPIAYFFFILLTPRPSSSLRTVSGSSQRARFSLDGVSSLQPLASVSTLPVV